MKGNVKETTLFEVNGNKLYDNGKTLCEEEYVITKN